MEWKDKIVDYVILHSGALIGAVIIMVIGFFAARWIGNLVAHWLGQKAIEPPVRMLIARIVRLLVVTFALVVSLGTAGVNVTAMVTGIGVAGVGIGLAMQGVLSNVVAGLTIIFTKPFRVGEYIEIHGVHGQVENIELFTTTLAHSDLSKVVIPNRKIVGEILHNYGTIRQLDLSVGVAYSTDLNRVLAIVHEILNQNPRVLKDPAPGVGIKLLADSSITLAIKPWATVPNYGPAGAEVYQSVIERFRANEIEIPFPQHDVRLLNKVPTAT